MKIEVGRRAVLTTLEVSAEDWQLYTYDEARRPASEIAAEAMNKALKDAVNSGCSREETNYIVSEEAKKHSETGSCDGEPRHVLSIILDKIYGEE